MTDSPLPVTIVGGYLGAGKTTLVNHVLRHARQPVAVLVNDFGDLDVDASLIVANDGDVLSFANGCVCCDLADGLITALDRIRAASPAPERVLIESSGVGELAAIANYASLPGLRLDATVCVVDTESIRERSTDRWVGDLVVGQLRAADLIVCNKIDLVTAPAVAEARSFIASIAPGSVVIDADHGRIDLDVLFDWTPMDPHPGTESTQVRHHADLRTTDDTEVIASSRFVSWVRTFSSPVPFDELRDAIDRLPTSVARAKGVVLVLDEGSVRSVLVQVVGRRREFLNAPGRAADARTPSNAMSFIAIREQFEERDVPPLLLPPTHSSHDGLH